MDRRTSPKQFFKVGGITRVPWVAHLRMTGEKVRGKHYPTFYLRTENEKSSQLRTFTIAEEFLFHNKR